MIKHYSLSYTKDINRIGEFDTVQLTLNYRTFPAKRKSKEMFTNLCEKFPNTKFICHYDYIYQASKFFMYTDSVRAAMVDELNGLLTLPFDNFIGVVMHTDTPFKKDNFKADNPSDYIRTNYNSRVFNLDRMEQAFGSSPHQIMTKSFSELAYLLLSKGEIRHNLYMENTTKTVPHHDIAHNAIREILNALASVDTGGKFGICIDTEHMYASDGDLTDRVITEMLPELLNWKQLPVMLHLNTIPNMIKPCGRLDRHSETTIFECSKFKPEQYLDLAERLIAHNVHFVREVKSTALDREQEQIKQWQETKHR